MTFKPTWLYIKQHTKTKLLYLGKTISNPSKYPGSGTVWRRHLKIHGKDAVHTLWAKRFESAAELTDFALAISAWFDVVTSPAWANLIPENGIDGAVPGRVHSIETKEKIRVSINRQPNFNHFKGIPKSDEWKLTHSNNMKGRPNLRCSCVKCKKEITVSSLSYHLKGQTCVNPLVIDDITYNTIFDASHALNCSKDTILYWLKTGKAKRSSMAQ